MMCGGTNSKAGDVEERVWSVCVGSRAGGGGRRRRDRFWGWGGISELVGAVRGNFDLKNMMHGVLGTRRVCRIGRARKFD